MSSRWTLSPRRSVIQTIYSFRHEDAVALRDAIWTLATLPIPPNATSIAELENGYEMQVGDYRITYQLVPERRMIRVLLIEIGSS